MTLGCLDKFRIDFTINSKDEKLSDGTYIDKHPQVFNLLKIAMWLPVIAQIFATYFGILNIVYAANGAERIINGKELGRTFVLVRCAIAFFATPLLILIDIIGTVVKYRIDTRNQKKDNLLQDTATYRRPFYQLGARLI